MKYPVKGRITSPFGWRKHPVTGLKSFHNGVDISCPIGTPVLCPAPGTVILADRVDNTSGGFQLIVKHTDGTRTGYAHLSEIMVNHGAIVETDQVICKTGNSGSGTGPHLHFTDTDAKGTKQDPQKRFTF